jgi:hypothetical protein
MSSINIRYAIANSILGGVESATTVDRNLLLDDSGFTSLLTNLVNGNLKELSIDDVVSRLVAYVNNNY